MAAANSDDLNHVVDDIRVDIGNLNANEINAPGAGAEGAAGGHRVGNVRDRLFHAMVVKVAVSYSSIVTYRWRRVIEFAILACALSMLGVLAYVHHVSGRYPGTCLATIKQAWPRKGILRVEVIQNLRELEDQFYDSAYGSTKFSLKEILAHGPRAIPAAARSGSIVSTIHFNLADTEDLPMSEEMLEEKLAVQPIFTYVVEYSLYHGLLKLPAQLRHDYKIDTMLYRIDGELDPCLGNWKNRLVTRYLVGVDDLIMSSLRALAENDTEKGYLRDLLSGEHYHFVTTSVSKASYISAFVIMLIFTFAISMLLRFSHHQIFLFILDLLQMFELNEPLVFPIAPLLTVILALVGMEAIMSEIFNDTSTAFYVILLVWMADQYDAICCRSAISRTHWLRFFYLYHFAYYAYQYKFSGQYNIFALLTSAMFILHAQIYFFHHYEIPLILHQEQLVRVLSAVHQETRMQGSGTDFILINRGSASSAVSGATTRRNTDEAADAAATPVAVEEAANAASSSSTAVAASARTPAAEEAAARLSAAEAENAAPTPPLNVDVITAPSVPTAAGNVRPPVGRSITFSYGDGNEECASSSRAVSSYALADVAHARAAATSVDVPHSIAAIDSRLANASASPDAAAATAPLQSAAQTVADDVLASVVSELFERATQSVD